MSAEHSEQIYDNLIASVRAVQTEEADRGKSSFRL